MRAGSRFQPEELVKAADPLPRAALTSGPVERALDDLGLAITSLRRRPKVASRRRLVLSRRATIALAALIAALSAGVATGAALLGAHTGIFPSKADQAVGGPGEALNPAASDFRTVALQISSDIAYPKGYASWRDWVIAEQAPTAEDGPGGTRFPAGLISSGALHGWFAGSAFCAWVQSWRQADIAGDRRSEGLAAQVIAEAPSWKAVHAEDPHPDPAAANDQGALSGTLFGWLLPYRTAVLSGDLSRVDDLLASGYGGSKCWLSDPAWMARLRAHRADWGNMSRSQLATKYEQYLARDGG